MMNYLKKILFVGSIISLFFVFAPSAFAGLVCTETTASTATITETSSFGFCVGSSFLFRNGNQTGIINCGSTYFDGGLAPSTSYSYTSSFGSTVCVTKASVGTVRVMPNITSATWTLTGPMTNQSGTGSVNLTNKNTGVYTIVWNNVAGYTKTVTTQTFSLSSGGILTFSNTYTLVPVVIAPTVSSPIVSSIASSSAVLGANVTSNGGAPITARGTCWGLTSTTATTCMTEGGIALGAFSHVRTGMPAGTVIYYRGYATNSAGTGYSLISNFSTLPGATIPTIITLPATSITSSSALLGFSFSNTGGAPITAKGLCWGTAPNPITNCNDYGPGSGAPGEWGGVIIGMPSGTLIYFRAYGTNSVGIGYSFPSMSFTTLNAPTIDLTASAVTPTTAIAGNSTSFSATINNTGTGGTGTSFTSLFQFDNDTDHITSVFTSQNSSTPAISAGGTANISTSYTFPSASTWYVRACADLNTAFVGTIAELPLVNENNNCGAWTSVTVVATTGTLTTPNCTISTGLSSCTSTVSWSINNPVPPSNVRQNGVSFSTAVSSAGTPRTLSYGSNIFELYSNGVTLVTNTATASCVVGTSWNGSVCAVPPAFSCTGATPLNAAIYAGDDVGLSANTPKTYSIIDTPPTKCQFSCNTGFSWNGTSCVASSCGDTVCNGTETLLTCPKDCKTKVIQF